MRILILGRPPAQGSLPPASDVVVCGEDLPEAPWYEAISVPDLTDLEQILYALTHAGQLEFDAVYCDYEHAMVNASMVASVVGASQALSPRLALLGRDKLAQKQLVAAAGVPTATVQMVPLAARHRARFRPSAAFPLIVKPVFGSASRDVRRVETQAEVTAALTSVEQREPMLCETYLPGRECHIDAVVTGGRLALLSVGWYLTNIIDTGVLRPAGSCVVPFTGHETLYERAEDLVLRCRAAFGLVDGVMHMEAFDRDDVLTYSECAFRRAGARVPETLTLATGQDYRRMSCLAALGLLPAGPVVRPFQAAAWAMVKVRPGHLVSMPADDRFASVQGLEQVSLRRDLVGRDVDEMSGAYHNAGFLIVAHPDARTARSEIERATKIFRDHVVVTPASGSARRARTGTASYKQRTGAR